MSERQESHPADSHPADLDQVDEQRPNPARMYDYALGGSANFAADRQAIDEGVKINPEGLLQARANRSFLRRAVRVIAETGVRQFIDLGSGIPTAGHVHQIVQRVDPRAHVVYVDNEPVAYRYSRSLLEDVSGTVVLPVDLRHARRVLDHPDTRRLIDLDQPVAVVMCAVLHFIMSDKEVSGLVAAYRDATVAGSYLAISHTCNPHDPKFAEIEQRYKSTTMPFRNRTIEEVGSLFAGYQLLEPGVVPVSDWRPDPGPDPNRPSLDVVIGGVGLRRSS